MKRLMIALSVAAVGLTGCASSYKPGVYQGSQVQQQMKVTLATVVSVREVEIEHRPTGAGASAGAAAGGVLGATNMDSRGGIVTSIAGAVIGGVVGNVAEKAANQKVGVEITYRVDGSQDMMALVQEKDETVFKPGDHIRIMSGSFSARAIKVDI